MAITPVLPAEFVEEIMRDLALSHDRMARALDMPSTSFAFFIEKRPPFSAILAHRLSYVLGSKPERWFALSEDYHRYLLLKKPNVARFDKLANYQIKTW